MTTVSSKYQEEFARRHLDALLPLFEHFISQKLNPKQVYRLLLWLMISQQRSKLQQLDYKALYSLLRPYQDHKFYRQLRKMYLTVGQQQSASLSGRGYHGLFAFLFSHFIFRNTSSWNRFWALGSNYASNVTCFARFFIHLGESLSILKRPLSF